MPKAAAGAFRDLDQLRTAIHADIFRAARSLYRIDARAGTGLDYVDLWPHQQRMYRGLLEQRRRREPPRQLVLKTRRAGCSTGSAMWTFHETYWRPRRHALVVAHHEATTNFLYGIYRTLYEELPDELQQPLQKLNRKEIACEAPWGSSIIAQTAGYMDIGRGMTLQHVHLSEIDYYPDPEVTLDGVLNTVAMHADTSIIIESTANGGDGWLHHFWKESRRGKTGFQPLFQAWFDVPEHRMPVPDAYEFTAEDKEWMNEFGIDGEQTYWYRRKRDETIAKEPWGGDRKMKQEYPFTEDEAFQSSGFCVFPDVVLAAAAQQAQPPRACYQLTATGGGQHVLVPADEERADLFVWEEPQPEAFYSLGIDIGGGVGRTESVISIWKYPGYHQVAEWASKNTSVDGTAFAARWLGEFYGGPKALLVPEINKDGPMILYILQGLPGTYEIFRWRYLDKVAPMSGDNPKLGWDCLDPSAKVLTRDLRWVDAAALQIGDELIGCEERRSTRRNLQLRPQRVVARRDFTAEKIEIVLANGVRTVVSDNHPFWADRDCDPQWSWLPAVRLRPGHRVKCLAPWETLTSHAAGWLAGILDGEGHLSKGRLGGLRMASSQAEGVLADEIWRAWQQFEFGPLMKWARHRRRPHEKPMHICGPSRTAGTLRALGALRPFRLLRKFVDTIPLDHLTVAVLPTVRVVSTRRLGPGPVIGLTTDPDHTLIADGIVGHNTNAVTKNILAQVFNMIALRGIHGGPDKVGTGEGVVRSHPLVEQMRRCIDIMPGKRWVAVGGLSDRIIAALIAVIGAYLEFEGGTVTVHGPVDPTKGDDKPKPWRPPGSYDDADEIFDHVMQRGGPFERPSEDYE